MPTKSKKQKDFMSAVAHNKNFAKKVGVPQSVGKDFNAADKGRTFKEGGFMKSDTMQDKAMVKKAVGMHDKQMHGGEKTNMDKLKKGGMSEIMKRPMPRRPMADEMPAPMMKKGGVTKMAKGGMASSRADGCAQRGKTRGRMI